MNPQAGRGDGREVAAHRVADVRAAGRGSGSGSRSSLSSSSPRRSTHGCRWHGSPRAFRSGCEASNGSASTTSTGSSTTPSTTTTRGKAPQKGGPGLTTLPSVGIGTHQPGTAGEAGLPPPNIKSVFAQPLPGEGVWRSSGPPVNGGPPVLVTTYRTETDYPQIVAYLAWFDHTRTASAYYPGRYEPPSAALRGPMQVPYSQRNRLLATFNGGFIYADGLNGDALNGVTNEPLKQGQRDRRRVQERQGRHRQLEGRPDRSQERRVGAPEPSADRRPRQAQPEPRPQHRLGLHARERRPRLAHRARDRQARQPHLRRRERPDRHLARQHPHARRRGARDGARHQSRVVHAHHVPPHSTARSCRRRSRTTTSSRPRGTLCQTIVTSSRFTGACRGQSRFLSNS